MFKNILVVCVGNICRSPTAEYLLKKQLAAKGRDVNVASAGLGALVGKPAHEKAAELANTLSVDMSPHVARQITEDMIKKHDLILVMERKHIKAVEAITPVARGKVHLLGRWHQNIEIPDPYKRGDAAFEHALSLIKLTVNDWAQKL